VLRLRAGAGGEGAVTAVVIRGDARRLPLPDACVDLIVTSPPYFGLRSYTDNVKCYDCIQMEYNGRDPRQAWPDYDAHVREVHRRHYDGQIGSEASPREWLAALVECTREWVRVLKPSGSLFVNLGDKYAGGGGQWEHDERPDPHRRRAVTGKIATHGNTYGMRPKSLLGLPWRYALACTDDLGLILRRDIIWSKPNGLPESVTDRCRSSHEYLFHLVRQPRYYAAVDEIREPHESPVTPGRRHNGAAFAAVGKISSADGTRHTDGHPLGKLPGSVWDIPSQPLTVPAHLGVDHFAAFPMELPRRCILGWSPPGVCTACGEGRRPVRGVDWAKVPHRMEERRALTEAERLRFAELFCDWQAQRGLSGREIAELFPSRTGGLTGCVANWRAGANILMPEQVDAIESRFGPLPAELIALVNLTRLMPVADFDVGIGGNGTGRHRNRHSVVEPKGYRAITGYACACPQSDAPTRPAVVLDPFGGTGTTALVAAAYGRTGISIDMSGDYSRLARWRTTDPAERAKAMLVAKPPPVPDGQVSLFDLEDAG
jgi:DNA modification methylase